MYLLFLLIVHFLALIPSLLAETGPSSGIGPKEACDHFLTQGPWRGGRVTVVSCNIKYPWFQVNSHVRDGEEEVILIQPLKSKDPYKPDIIEVDLTSEDTKKLIDRSRETHEIVALLRPDQHFARLFVAYRDNMEQKEAREGSGRIKPSSEECAYRPYRVLGHTFDPEKHRWELTEFWFGPPTQRSAIPAPRSSVLRNGIRSMKRGRTS